MNDLKITIFFLFLFSCTYFGQDKIQIVNDEEANKPMLVGVSTIEALKNDTSFSKWFNKEYEEYYLNKKDLISLTKFDSTYKIIIVMGTWCSDSRREVPRLIKILDTLNYPAGKINVTYVNREKKDLIGTVDSLSIKLVPTIIIYHDDKELGRIVEAPEETLEKDLEKIISKK